MTLDPKIKASLYAQSTCDETSLLFKRLHCLGQTFHWSKNISTFLVLSRDKTKE